MEVKESPIKLEKNREKHYQFLIDKVNKIYDEVENGSEKKKELIEEFKKHNEIVLSYVEELTKQENITEEELEIINIAAIFHDSSKLGIKTEEGKIKKVPLVKHHIESAKIAEKILKELEEDPKIIDGVKDAILCHMGPIPGFMEEQKEKWNKEYSNDQVQFLRPEKITAKILYDADMLTLIRQLKKIIVIRQNNAIFFEEDQKIANERRISIEEARLNSALQNAKQALNSLYTKSAKKIAKELLNKSEQIIREELGLQKNLRKVT